MGYSNIQIILIPALTSFVIGYIIVFLIVPFSSSMLKYYEDLRSEYNETKNLVFVNETGIWILDKNEKEKNIIRIEKINKDFSTVSQITIYNYDASNNFIKRIDAAEGSIKDKNWLLNNVKIISSNKKNNKVNNLNNYNYMSNVNINELKNIYKNAETTSLLEINKDLKENRMRPYKRNYELFEYKKPNGEYQTFEEYLNFEYLDTTWQLYKVATITISGEAPMYIKE
jgi:lipopolysaccharide export LptBFGC system permease protein LptF